MEAAISSWHFSFLRRMVTSEMIRAAKEAAEAGGQGNGPCVKESSKTKPTEMRCRTCMEMKMFDRSFQPSGCDHLFCSDCVVMHVTTKLGDNLWRIPCMEARCTSEFELESCLSILTPEVVDRWAALLSESLIQNGDKIYCPFQDCSALMWNDSERKESIKDVECPHCHRLFCAQCKVGWHAGINCREYQRTMSWEKCEDAMMMEMAKERKWQRCPRCQFYVERSDGCQQMTCRCGFRFCYNCGSQWSAAHSDCGGLS
ncbi:unnamed protein product [Victoria cruziana]